MMNTKATIAVWISIILFGLIFGIGLVDVYAEVPTNAQNFTVEMTKNGFSTNSLSVNKGDSVTFVNKHYVTATNLEPHAISDPFAVPYTVHSYWILDDSTPSHKYVIPKCETY